jgi:RNA polymerase sigma factor (sigma-70 family)
MPQFEPDHVLLRCYHDAQESGDAQGAAEAWEQLAVQNFDRMKQIVKAFRFPGGQRLPEHEQGSALSELYLRVEAMGAGFRKREPGQYYAALVTTAWNTCMDYGRKEMRHEQHSGGSIDERFDDGDGGPFDSVLKRYDEELRQRREDALESERSAQHAESLVHWAIGQIKNDNYREVLELTYIDKLSAEQIADQLGISPDNVYARRSRGLKELEKILRGQGT